MPSINPEVQAERIRVMEKEIKEIKSDLQRNEDKIDKFPLIIHRLEQIEKTLGTMSKDAGWRGFFLDFIKAAAQIAVLVGAGKWIF